MWVRGLKLSYIAGVNMFNKSHPVWVRGLKLDFRRGYCQFELVAPRVGAWIETQQPRE